MARRGAPLTIPLQGGLGNQLFQLAAGLALARRTGRQVRYSDHWLQHPEVGETPRSLAIDDLLAPGELMSAPTRRHGTHSDRFLARGVVERSADDDTLGRVRGRTRIVAGYLQSAAYAQEAWPVLRERLLTSTDARQRALVDAPRATYGALHYRLGDYRSNPHAARMHGISAPEYFAGIVRLEAARRDLRDWLLVSDEPELARELLDSVDLPADVTLSVPGATNDWGDLLTLASAQVCAISNSSFSWWAGFIGRASHGADVVAPRPWFLDPSAVEPALIPPDWIRMDREVIELPPR